MNVIAAETAPGFAAVTITVPALRQKCRGYVGRH